MHSTAYSYQYLYIVHYYNYTTNCIYIVKTSTLKVVWATERAWMLGDDAIQYPIHAHSKYLYNSQASPENDMSALPVSCQYIISQHGQHFSDQRQSSVRPPSSSSGRSPSLDPLYRHSAVYSIYYYSQYVLYKPLGSGELGVICGLQGLHSRVQVYTYILVL